MNAENYLGKLVVARTAREKVIEADRQIHAMLAGELSELSCPFCGQVTPINGDGCCKEMADVIFAVLNHRQFKKQKALMEQIAEKIGNYIPDYTEKTK